MPRETNAVFVITNIMSQVIKFSIRYVSTSTKILTEKLSDNFKSSGNQSFHMHFKCKFFEQIIAYMD